MSDGKKEEGEGLDRKIMANKQVFGYLARHDFSMPSQRLTNAKTPRKSLKTIESY